MQYIPNFLALLVLFSFLAVSCDTLNELASTNHWDQNSSTRTASYNDTRSAINLDATKQKLLFKYLMDGDLEGVKKAEGLGANLDYGTSYKEVNLPIYTALDRHYMVMNLAQHGAPHYAKDQPKMLPIINYLRSKSTTLDQCTGAKQYCIINKMCRQSKRECKKAIEEWNMDKSNLEPKLYSGGMQIEVLEYLLEQGMDAGAGDNPLVSIEKFKQHPEKLRKLLANGADRRINEKVSSRGTPLVDAAMGNHPVLLDILLEFGADPRVQCDKAMNRAIYKGHIKIVESLLKAGVNPNDSCHSSFKNGMLDYALGAYAARDTKIIDLLLDAGAK